MRYFSRQWATGAVPDDDVAAAQHDYARHLQRLQPQLPAPVAHLATAIDLHDALLRAVVLDRSQRTLILKAVTGDLQKGYQEIALCYSAITVSAACALTLQRRVHDPATEILYDEIDLEGGAFIHRLLFWPEDEVELRFGTLEITERPVSGRCGHQAAGAYDEKQ